MPWEIKKNGDQECIHKKGESKPIKGGCHSSHADAVKHLKALYANEAMSERQFTILAFSEQGKVVAGEPIWIHATTPGEWVHPMYGEQTFDEQRFSRMVQGFKDGVYGQDLPVTFEHFGMDKSKGFKAAGWVKDVEARPDGLWYQTTFTQEAADEINAGAWKYFSFEWHDYWENEKGVPFLDVLAGGALTNNPFRKGMTPLNFSELSVEVVDESVEIEHSEPGTIGTGGEPVPREDESEKGGRLGDRRDTPPFVKELEDNMEEFLRKLAEALGIEAKDDELNEEKILEGAGAMSDTNKQLVDELAPLRKAKEEAEGRKTFREQFPEEYEKMVKLEETNRENQAMAFSEDYAKFGKRDDQGKVTEREARGFSGRTLDLVAAAHKDIAARTFSHQSLRELLDSIAETGIVDYSERGSGRGRERVEIDDSNPRNAFAEHVKEIMEQDDMTFEKAIEIAAEQYPEAFAAYNRPLAG